MTAVPIETRRLKVAIIGGGPGGLGASIALSRLGFVDWALYEKKPQISETGGGISLQQHTWRMLEWNGAAKHISPNSYSRSSEGISVQIRNGRNATLLHEARYKADVPDSELSCRVRRCVLQGALLREVDQSKVKTSTKLTGLDKLPDGRVTITFEDGSTDTVDLLVAADGIRSNVRSIVFPQHKIIYNGQSAYRTIIPTSAVKAATDIPHTSVFWENLGGRYVFTCPLGGDDFEVTARIRRPAKGQEHVSWGRPFDFSSLVSEYDGFCGPVRKVVDMAAKAGGTEEFALFSGSRLDSIVALDAIALIGDASHPLSGAFGAGAGFALEDSYVLASAIQSVWNKGGGIAEALELYDEIRSPHYRALYDSLDSLARVRAAVTAEKLLEDAEIEEQVRRTSGSKNSWMYTYDVQKAVAEKLGSSPI